MKKILTLIFLSLCAIDNFAQPTSPGRSTIDPAFEPFYHGVASGDPLSDRVILWTRITTTNASENVGWQIATDQAFSNIVNSGNVTTDASKDFTVKVDATGLQPNSWYYYRFSGQGKNSLIGRTRTAPTTGVNNLRFAVASCSNFPNGFFHVYRDIVNKNEVDAVLHLGDYIYEYKTTSAVPGDTTRNHYPDKEILTLADYRMRHSQYKLDDDLRDCHRQFPFITVWDDHETTNNSWKNGAENHTEGAEGIWNERKSFGRKAYFEWMPIREAAAGNDSTIYRNINFGNLADLIMVDTRLEGRDQQVPGTVVSINNATIQDTNRTLLGVTQRDWLNNQLKTSTATWKVVGNQVMVAPLILLGSSIANSDQWDGYPHDRKKVFDNILNNNVNDVIFLTGDIHTSWANDLPNDRSAYNATTGAGSVAVEFVCTSVTSGSGNLPVSASVIQQSNPYMKFIDLIKRGYVSLDLTQQKAQGDFIFVSDITVKPFTSTVAASWFVNKGERFLRQATAANGPRTGMPSLAANIINNIIAPKSNIISLMCYPNPFTKEVQMQYYLHKSEVVTATLFDAKGQKVFEKQLGETTNGLHEETFNLEKLGSGNYFLQLTSPNGKTTKELVKVQ
jgi:alkaline phosphatase D